MAKIKAAVCHAFGTSLEVQEVDLRAPEPGEVEVTLEACAVCFSDISFVDGGWGGTLPAVFGHEAAGRISALGAGVRGYAVGQAVIVTLIRSCGTCAPCASGAPVRCASAEPSAPLSLGGAALHAAMNCGAFAEKVVVHSSQLAAIPDDMPMDAASLLSCGVVTGLGAVVNTARVRPGQVVVVIGAGGVGLNAVQGARISGAARIVAVDMTEQKLADAREFGATDGILATDPAPWERLAELTGGRMADAVFVTVGAIPAYNAAPNYLARGGAVYMVGMPHTGQEMSFEPANLAAYGQSLVGTKMGDVVLARDIPWLVEIYQQGRLKLEELISGRYALEDINAAIADTKSGAARRNVIVFK
jgi:Zn-dependent alcohol dehydrogenase